MATISYRGKADVREVSSAELARAGFSGMPSLRWDRSNDFTLTDVPDPVVAMLLFVDSLPVFIQHGVDDTLIGNVNSWATQHNAVITNVPGANHTSIWQMMNHRAFAEQIMEGARW